MAPQGFEQWDRPELIGLVRTLDQEITNLQCDNAALQKELERLKGRPPKPPGKTSKKRPGRKPGQGNFTRRKPPPEPSGPVEEAQVEERRCPDCGGGLVPDGFEEVTTTDLPEPPRPVTRTFHLQVCRCGKCGRRVRASHPEVPPDQTGATAHRVGERAKAVALVLHYSLGIPVRRVPGILHLLGGLKITHSALVQMALGHAGRKEAKEAYARLRREISQAAVVHTDDTGWRVGGRNAQMMAFDSAQTSVYQVRPRHRNEEVREVIGDNFQGVLVCDRGKSYDAEQLSGVKQSKCVPHLLRSVEEVVKKQPPAAQTVGMELRGIFERALGLWHSWEKGEVSLEEYRARGQPLLEALRHALRPRRLRGDNATLVAGLRWQMQRGHLLRFLEDPTIPPTNNDAERMLREVVLERKVSQGSKNERGAQTCAVMRSILRTAGKRGMDMVATAVDVVRCLNPFSSRPADPNPHA
ncbi:MAG TPA: IS66 family transposase [Isosphaeraceae bacterium]|nr:IS66 family transposase [Isosphaeraceae bacterium]